MDNYYKQPNMYSRDQYNMQSDAPHYELYFVDGKKGAMDFPMGPRSTILLPDKNEQIVWYVETDNFGHKTVCDDYEMTLRYHEPEPDYKSLYSQIDELTKKLTNLEVQLGVESMGTKEATVGK